MFTIKLALVMFLTICHVSYCARRIHGGQIVSSNKTYVVYLVKASLSIRNYDFWLCGGALVTRDFILTSAACVEDVNFLYAIAGYNTYVTDSEIDTNECTKQKKKKVVFTCVPVSYDFDFDSLEKWSHIDIALARVESPYDLEDDSYTKICSYIPTIIPINYDPKYQMSDIDALVMGWGHAEIWRKNHDTLNYNKETLHYASTLIMDKQECKRHYEVYPNMNNVIDQYMICTLEAGNINDKGEPIQKPDLSAQGCGPDQIKLTGVNCDENDYGFSGPILVDNTRREIKEPKKIYNYTTYEYIKRVAQKKNAPSSNTRKNGICQNDHGGPLVTWVGKREVLIGIASVFKVTEDSECIGPFLYTSTQCNGAFLNCVLSFDTPDRRSQNVTALALCDSPPNVKGFDTIENHISWKDHPAGPAANEILNSPNPDNIRENMNLAVQEIRQENAANVRPAGNGMYQYQDGIRANEKYIQSANYAANERLKNNMYAAKGKYIPDDRVARIGNDKNDGDGGLLMRPQRPLHI